MLNWDKEIQWVCFIYSLRNDHWKWSSNLAKQILRNGAEDRMLKWWCGSQTSCQSGVNSSFRPFLQSSGWSPASRPAEVCPLLHPQRCWVFRDRTKSEHWCTNHWVSKQWEVMENKTSLAAWENLLPHNRLCKNLSTRFWIKVWLISVITEVQKINPVVC